jgi:hypothetical protein
MARVLTALIEMEDQSPSFIFSASLHELAPPGVHAGPQIGMNPLLLLGCPRFVELRDLARRVPDFSRDSMVWYRLADLVSRDQ